MHGVCDTPLARKETQAGSELGEARPSGTDAGGIPQHNTPLEHAQLVLLNQALNERADRQTKRKLASKFILRLVRYHTTLQQARTDHCSTTVLRASNMYVGASNGFEVL